MSASKGKGFGKSVKSQVKVKEKLSLRLGRKYKSVLRECTSVHKSKKFEIAKPDSLEQKQIAKPDSLEEKHWQELIEESAIDPEIAELNFRSLSGNAAYDYLLYSPKLGRTNTGRLSSGYLKRYSHLGEGGWWASGIDVHTWEDSVWGCFKPNNPRFDEEKEKDTKYEVPPKVLTEIFALRVPAGIWQLISRRYSVALPKDYKQLEHADFWKWVVANNLPVIITEGVKKAAAILSCGYVGVAVPGINNAYRQPKDEEGNVTGLPSLIPQLQIFATEGRRIYFCYDQDSKRNTVRAVNSAISKTAKLFKKEKCEVGIIKWHSLWGKGIDDVIVSHGREKLDELYRSALEFDEWQSRQSRHLTYTPDMIINERYIGEIVPPESAQLITVQSPKGTNKTGWLSYLCDPVLRSAQRRILFITHRVQLSLQGADRLGIPYITQVKEAGEGALLGYGLCIDSLHPKSQARFNFQEWTGAWIILDEIQQVLWHLLSSDTCKNDRVQIIKTLQQLLRHVIATGGKIFLADADLNDVAIDFIEGLLESSPERFILVNKFRFNEPWKIYRFKGKDPSQLIAKLEQELVEGEKALLNVSAQKVKSTYSGKNIEDRLKEKYPHLRILRIDSETVQNPEHPAFRCTRFINEVVVNYDLVIASPTIETGVSIDAGHFDGVWGIFQGVQTTDGVRQHLSRERKPVPRYVWIKPRGLGFVGNRKNSPAGLIASQKQLDVAHRKKLSEAFLMELPDGNFSPTCLNTWSKLGAIINMGMWRYEETILADLIEEGHHIIDWEEAELEAEVLAELETEVLAEVEGMEELEECSSQINIISPEKVKEEMKSIRDRNYTEYREQVASSEKLSDIEFEKLSKQQERKTAELLQLRKAGIERKYEIDCTPDLVKKDDDKWGSKIRLYYFLKPGREHLIFKDAQLVEKALSHGNGDYFIPDTNKGLMQLKVAFFDYLGVQRLYESHGFHNEHEVIIDIFEKIKNNVHHVKTVVGLDLSKQVKDEKNRLKTVQDVLALLGHKMTCYARVGKRNNQIRYYSSPAAEFSKDGETKKLILAEDGLPIPLSDGREAVFEAWLQRDAEAQRKVEDEKAAAAAMVAAEEARRKAEQEAAAAAEAVRKAEEEAEREIWSKSENLQDVVDYLELCDSSEMLQGLRQCFPAFVLKNACDLISDVKRVLVKQWVCEQNAAA